MLLFCTLTHTLLILFTLFIFDSTPSLAHPLAQLLLWLRLPATPATATQMSSSYLNDSFQLCCDIALEIVCYLWMEIIIHLLHSHLYWATQMRWAFVKSFIQIKCFFSFPFAFCQLYELWCVMCWCCGGDGDGLGSTRKTSGVASLIYLMNSRTAATSKWQHARVRPKGRAWIRWIGWMNGGMNECCLLWEHIVCDF